MPGQVLEHFFASHEQQFLAKSYHVDRRCNWTWLGAEAAYILLSLYLSLASYFWFGKKNVLLLLVELVVPVLLDK